MFMQAARGVIVGFLMVSLISFCASAQTTADPSARLQKSEKTLGVARSKTLKLRGKAAELEEDIVRIREGLVAAAGVIQHQETLVEDRERRLQRLVGRQREINERFRQRRRQLGYVLAALQRMSRRPPEALIALPMSPADTVRSAILLRTTLPMLERQAKSLRTDLDTLVTARRQTEDQRRELDEELSKLESQRLGLSRMLGRKSRLRRRTVTKSNQAERHAANLARETKTLRDLVGRLQALRAKREVAAKRQRQATGQAPRRSKKTGTKAAAPVDPSAAPPKGYTGKPLESAKGKLPFPVVGKVVARYGQAVTKGSTRKGISLQTAAKAQVIAPYEGHVVFAGQFRGYGLLLIIEHSGGYHSLLAGMAHIDTSVGQWVLAGEPVGVMAEPGVRNPTLYVEFRREGQPINPLPWMAARKGKVSG